MIPMAAWGYPKMEKDRWGATDIEKTRPVKYGKRKAGQIPYHMDKPGWRRK